MALRPLSNEDLFALIANARHLGYTFRPIFSLSEAGCAKVRELIASADTVPPSDRARMLPEHLWVAHAERLANNQPIGEPVTLTLSAPYSSSIRRLELTADLFEPMAHDDDPHIKELDASMWTASNTQVERRTRLRP